MFMFSYVISGNVIRDFMIGECFVRVNVIMLAIYIYIYIYIYIWRRIIVK